MRILITGGTGFIGSRTAEALLEGGGHEVTLTGRSAPKWDHKGARFLRGDLIDPEFAKRACADQDAVIHCAGLAGTWGDYRDYNLANVVATQNILQGARAAGVKRVVNVSSPSIYFQYKDQFDLKENQVPPRFSNHYAQTKFEAERLMQFYHSDEMMTVSLRPRAVIGRGDQNILPRLLRLAREGQLVQVGDGDNVVDITTVENVIEAIRLCLSAAPEAMGQSYNITNGEPVRFWDFVDDVLHSAGLPVTRRKLPYAVVMAAAKVNESVSLMLNRQSEPALLPISVGVLSFSMTLDISKAREQLGYKPVCTTRDGIRSYFAN